MHTIARRISAIAVPCVLLMSIAVAGATIHVPGDYATIQAAVNAAGSGDTIVVAAGTYAENVVVNKAVTIQGPNVGIDPNTGTRVAEAVVIPAATDTSAGRVFDVQVSGVTIDGFTIDGHNSSLTGGTSVGGVDVFTAVGISNGDPGITAWPPTTTNNPQVDHVTVQNCIFQNLILNGIYFQVGYGTSHGFFYLDHNLFTNMYEGIQTYAVLVDESDNVFAGVSRALSMHQVSADVAGFTPQVVGNSMTAADVAGYSRDDGFWINGWHASAPPLVVSGNVVNVPASLTSGFVYRGFQVMAVTDACSVTLQDNVVNGNGRCDIGLYAFNIASTASVTWTGGQLNGIGADGVLVATTDSSWGAGDTYLTVRNVPITLTPAAVGANVYVDPANPTKVADLTLTSASLTGGAAGVVMNGSTAAADVHFCRIYGNSVGISNVAGAVSATDNWWGCNGGPGASGCDAVSGTVTFDPWLVLQLSTSTTTAPASGGTIAATTDLSHDRNGADVSGSGLLPNGIPVAFSATLGTMSPTSTQTSSAQASSTFTAGTTPGTGSISVTVDGETVTVPVTLTAAPDLTVTKTHTDPFRQGDWASQSPSTAVIGPVANTTGNSTTAPPGFGPTCLQAVGPSKAEIYVPATALFGHAVTVGDLASISWYTNKASGTADWAYLMYTVPQGDGQDSAAWYRSRLNSEPYLSGGTYTPNAWTLWSTAAAHPQRFYDSNRDGGVFGTYTDPLLSDITGGPVTWPKTGTTWDYSGEQILYFSIQTGSGWSPAFNGLVDGLTVTLKGGQTATVNFEAGTDSYTITVTNAGSGPTSGTVTVQDYLPTGLTALSFSGPGWTTDLGALTATRSDALAAGASYPPLILNVKVAASATSPQVNQVTVSGGGESNTSNDTASDSTTIAAAFTTPSVVYVNKAWNGLGTNTSVTANGGTHYIGYDAFAVIQAGLDAVASSGSVYVYPTAPNPLTGYGENLVISKPLTLAKAPDAAPSSAVVIYPALSAPNPAACSGASLCSGSSNIALVQADNVTIHDLTLDGNNPSLTSGVSSNGVDVDARNGIITNHTLGTYNSLTVYNCTVQNIYLRGIYASSGGTFNFHDNTVQNVMADPASIGIFNFGGAGTMEHNTVSDCNDGISSNHSRGIQFLNNVVSNSGSGIHTDNAGDGGGSADLIQGNTITNCDWGIWVFVPYIAPTVQNNVVTDSSSAGLAAAGGAFSGATQTARFLGNTVTSTTAAPGSVGFYLTDDTWGYGQTNVSVDLENNTLSGWDRGIQVETLSHTTSLAGAGNAVTANKVGFEILAPTAGGTPDVTFNHNGIYANTSAGFSNLSTVDAYATCVWWNSPSGPNPPGTGDTVSSHVLYTPWSSSSTAPYDCAGGCVVSGSTYVDDDYAGLPLGTVVTWPRTGGTGSHIIGCDAFAAVQDGINAVAAGGTVNVAAGSYPQNLTITKALSLVGPNAGTKGYGLPRAAEAVLMPSTVGTDPNNTATSTTILRITAADVTVSGFTFDGDNPVLTGVTMNGVDSDACAAISTYASDAGNASAVGNITISDNIIKNFTYAGVDLESDGSTAVSGSLVKDNAFDNLSPTDSPATLYGIAVVLYDDHYADVTGNHVTNARKGVQTGNFHLANPGSPVQISGNVIDTWKTGIWHNLHYQSASPFQIFGNTLTAAAGSTQNIGLRITSIQSAVTADVHDNTITGGLVGIEVWNVPTSSGIALAGDSVTGAATGLLFTNDEAGGYGMGSGGSLTLGTSGTSSKGVSITGCSAYGIRVWDDPTNTNASPALSLAGTGVTLTGDVVGVQVENGRASATLTESDLSDNTSFGANNLGGTLSATCDWWGDATGPYNATSNPGGLGDKAGDNVTFSTWSTTPGPSYTCSGCLTTVASSNSPVCEGSTLSLTTPTIPGALSYSWTGPNGFTSTSQNPTIPGVTTAAAGTYSVTVTTASCTSPAATTDVTIEAAPQIDIQPSPVTVCQGGSATFTAGATGAGITYQWYGPAGAISGATGTSYTLPSAAPSDAGNYYVVVTGTCGVPATSATAALTVIATPPSSVYVDTAYTGDAAGTVVTWPNSGGSGSHVIGCDAFATIQDGVNAVGSGGTVEVAPGTYPENVVISKGLTLMGADRATTVLRPATSAPLCTASPCDTLCSGGASIILLVRANDVTIHDLTLDGTNPTLDPGNGVTRGGVTIHARGGIVTDYNAGTFDNLTVYACTVRNVYLRGIYAASTGTAHTLDIHDNTVANVQGDDCAIGIFSRYASGTISHNTVTGCLDAISSNWSRGLQFLDNVVSSPGTTVDPGTGLPYPAAGIHTDNPGWGGAADAISGNQVTGYDQGIWVFYPNQGVTVSGNTVNGCRIGMALYGGTATPTTTAFSGNTVTGPGAAVAGSAAFLLTSHYPDPSFPTTAASASVNGNTLQAALSGVYVQPLTQSVSLTGSGNVVIGNGTGLTVETEQAGGAASVTFTQNDLSANGSGVLNQASSTAQVTCNWWGSSSGPYNATGNPFGAGDSVSANATYAPWSTTAPPAYTCDGYSPPTLASGDITGPYVAGVQQGFNVTLTNPTSGAAYAHVRANFRIANTLLSDLTSLQYTDGVNWYDVPLVQSGSDVTGYFGPVGGFPLTVPYSATTPFRVTFATAKTYGITITLVDLDHSSNVLATLSASATVSGCTPPGPVGPTLRITEPDPAHMLLTWDLIPNADHYVVWRADDPAFTQNVVQVGTASGIVNGLQLVIANEPANAYYRVQAFQGICAGPMN